MSLASKLQDVAVEVLIRKGGMSEREIKEFQERLRVNQGSRVILASGKAIGEGFDDPGWILQFKVQLSISNCFPTKTPSDS